MHHYTNSYLLKFLHQSTHHWQNTLKDTLIQCGTIVFSQNQEGKHWEKGPLFGRKGKWRKRDDVDLFQLEEKFLVADKKTIGRDRFVYL